MKHSSPFNSNFPNQNFFINFNGNNNAFDKIHEIIIILQIIILQIIIIIMKNELRKPNKLNYISKNSIKKKEFLSLSHINEIIN